MRQQAHGRGIRGPLDVEASLAGQQCGNSNRLQRAITEQLEQGERDALHADFAALPAGSPLRQAWFGCDAATSAAWVTSHASHDNIT